MKKTLNLTLVDNEGVKIEVSAEVLKIETDNHAIHPDDPNQGTITEYWCKEIEYIKFNGFHLTIMENGGFVNEISRLVESQLESNSELFNEG